MGVNLLPAAVAQALNRFRHALEERFGDRLRQVRLFGSYARGDAWEESDVDVLVLIDGVTEQERYDVISLAWRAGDVDPGTWLILSPLVRTPAASP